MCLQRGPRDARAIVLVLVLLAGCSFATPRWQPKPNDPKPCHPGYAIADTVGVVVPTAGAIALVRAADDLGSYLIAAIILVPVGAITSAGYGIAALKGYYDYGKCRGERSAIREPAAVVRPDPKRERVRELVSEIGLVKECAPKAMLFKELEQLDPGTANDMLLPSVALRDCLDEYEVENEQRLASQRACSAARARSFAALDASPPEQRATLARALPNCTEPPNDEERAWRATRDAVLAALAKDCAAVAALDATVQWLDRPHHVSVFERQSDIAACLTADAQQRARERKQRREACLKARSRLQLEASAIVDLDERARAFQLLPKCEDP